MGRKMNCRTKFGDDTPSHPLYTNTGFEPDPVDPTIDAYLDETRISLEEMNIPQATSRQLTNEERKALGNLKNLDHIVILKADKNSTIVVMDKDDYIKEGLRQLASIHYTQVTNTPNPTEPNRQNKPQIRVFRGCRVAFCFCFFVFVFVFLFVFPQSFSVFIVLSGISLSLSLSDR